MPCERERAVIYAIRAVGTEYIKFGYTDGKTYKRRVETLQTGCPYDLEELAMCEGDYREERAIHNRLCAAGAHHRGEWFKDCEEARKIIAEMQANQVSMASHASDILRIWKRKASNISNLAGRKSGGWATEPSRTFSAPEINMAPADDANDRFEQIKRLSLDRQARRAASKAPQTI